jgi:hypothetical protein
VSRASAGTFILTLDTVNHLQTLDQGTKRNTFLVQLRSLLEWGLFSDSAPRKLVGSLLQAITLEVVLMPPTLPGFYPHSEWTTVGPVHVGVRFKAQVHHNDDGPGLLGYCHLTSDLPRPAHDTQLPEQGGGYGYQSNPRKAGCFS